MAHLHVHTVGDRETSAPVIDPDDESLHWHTLGGNRTSSNGPLGGDHTHTIDGDTTSPPIDRDSKKTEPVIKRKSIGVRIAQIEEKTVDGVKIGIVSGHILTWDVDRGFWGIQDQFVKGSTLNALARHRKDNRPIRLKREHATLIGGFPIETVHEDEKGLFGIGNINLNTQDGIEAFALAKQGVLSDFSVGWQDIKSSIVDDIRIIEETEIWEGSLVEEPMNPEAKVTDVKSVVPFQDMPLASRDRAWDSKAAVARIREFTDSTESPTDDYKKAFIFCDCKKRNEFSSYKLPIADIVNGKLVVVKDALLAAAKALHANVPENAIKEATRHIERYCAKMDIDSPFSDNGKQYFTSSQVKLWTPRDCERELRKTGMFSKNGLKTLASRLDSQQKTDENTNKKGFSELFDQLKSLKESMR